MERKCVDMKGSVWMNRLLWIVYLCLLGVLLPHTAWAFSQFEPLGNLGTATAYMAATAFEMAIAGLTHKLAKHIESTPKRTKGLRRFRYYYVNSYSLGLVASIGVSSLANLAHAVQFGRRIKIFDEYDVPFGLYAVAFGAILPIISLLFARVLSNVSEDGEGEEELDLANKTIRDLRTKLHDVEGRALDAEGRFEAAGDLFAELMRKNKRDRIIELAERFPELPGRSIAIITESSPSYVSEVITEVGVSRG